MTDQTQAPTVITALVTAWKSALSSYGNRVNVFDGPPVTGREREIELWVGATGDEVEETVITGTQEWTTLAGLLDRDEDIEITSAILVYSTTGTDIATCRQTAFDVFNAAITAVRGLDLYVNALYAATGVSSWELRQGQYNTGPGVRILFTLKITGRV